MVESVSRGALRTRPLAPNDRDQGRGDNADIARVALTNTVIDTEEGPKTPEPGMTVTTELKTSQRRVTDCVLSPPMRYRQGS